MLLAAIFHFNWGFRSAAASFCHIKNATQKSYHPLHRHHVAPVVTQHGSPCQCHTRCLPSPRCRMKQCLLIIFDTVHFDTWKWATVSLTDFAVNVTLTLTVSDCHGIALVAFWLSWWHLGLNFEEWNWLIKCNLDWLDTVWWSVATSLSTTFNKQKPIFEV